MDSPVKLSIEAALSKTLLCADLNSTELRRIAHSTREIYAKKGEILFHKGEPCTGVHLVVSGQLKLALVSSVGKEKIVELLGAGQSYGEDLLLAERPYGVYGEALSDSLLLHVSRQALLPEIEAIPALARKMLNNAANRTHTLVDDVEAYSLHSGKQRIVGFLMHELDNEQASAALGGRPSILPAHKVRVLRFARPGLTAGTLFARPVSHELSRTSAWIDQADGHMLHHAFPASTEAARRQIEAWFTT